MILFNQNDDYDRKQQLEYLNDLPQYKLFRLKSVPDQMKTYDFYNEKCIIEFKKRTCNHEPCLLYTSPSPRDGLLSRMPSSA